MFFTGKGDDGSTGWLGEGRLPKYDLRIEALGCLDECTATLGLARSLMTDEQALALTVQRDLYRLMAEVASSPENAEIFMKITDDSVKDLEAHIQRLEKKIEIPSEFIVPGDSQASAAVALSRTVVRRAERRVVEMYDRGMTTNPHLGAYLNRLSSLCFVLEIFLVQQAGKSGPTLAKRVRRVTGTWINVAAILVGGVLGLLLGSRLPERVRQTVIAGLGLFTLAYGFKLFIGTGNALVVLGSLLLGVLIGEALQIDCGLHRFGVLLEERFNKVNGGVQDNRFVKGFVTSSLVFCIGPMAILGSIQDGLTGDYQILAVKSILDGFGALAFASSLGVGVLFSAGVVLLYQGGISLLAVQVQSIVTESMMVEMSATGGVLLLAVAISSLLEIKPLRTGNFLPALLIAPLMVLIMQALGIY